MIGPIPTRIREFAKQNFSELTEEIKAVCKDAGRNPEDITVVAVIKYMSDEQALALYESGIRDFAENYAQRLENRVKMMADAGKGAAVKWHFIGQLQKNKINRLLNLNVSLIHSIGSYGLLQAIARRMDDKTVNCLLQVNFGLDKKDYGFAPGADLEKAVKFCQSRGIKCKGLMTIAPYTDDEKIIRKAFSMAKKQADGLGLAELSMGMSRDFKIAIEEGATILRIGSYFMKN